MRRLTYAAVEALLKKPPTQRIDLMDGAVPGLMLRVGPRGATWSMRIRVVGEGGVTNRGHRKKDGKFRLTLGEYRASSIELPEAWRTRIWIRQERPEPGRCPGSEGDRRRVDCRGARREQKRLQGCFQRSLRFAQCIRPVGSKWLPIQRSNSFSRGRPRRSPCSPAASCSEQLRLSCAHHALCLAMTSSSPAHPLRDGNGRRTASESCR